jgi:hypothetical protein
MKKLPPILLLLLMAVYSVASAAEVITSTVPLQGVSRIQINGSNDLYFTQGDTEFVKITAERAMLDQVEARVKGSMLYLSSKRNNRGWFSADSHVRFDVQLQDLGDLRMNGSGNAWLGDLNVANLMLTLNGSGDLQLQSVTTSGFRMKLTGSGNIDAGNIDAEQVQLRIFGSGEMEVPGITAETVNINIAGSGDIDVDRMQAEALEISISGSGDIALAGTVEQQRIEIYGSGNYRARDLYSNHAEIEVGGSGNVVVNVDKYLSTYLSRGASVNYHGGPDLVIDAGGRGRIYRDN